MKKYIGNVVAQLNIKLERGLKRCSTLEEANHTLPTIIVGIETARTAIPDFSILKRRYNQEQLWWTFSRSERLYDYKEDMQSFYRHCISTVDRNVKYTFVDVKKMTRERTKRLLRYMQSPDKKYIYNDSDKFLFIYSPAYKRIWGISLSTCNYMGIRTRGIMERVRRNPKNEVIKDFTVIPYTLRSVASETTHKLMVLYDNFV